MGIRTVTKTKTIEEGVHEFYCDSCGRASNIYTVTVAKIVQTHKTPSVFSEDQIYVPIDWIFLGKGYTNTYYIFCSEVCVFMHLSKKE